LNSIKSIAIFIVFLLIGAGFAVLINFEISYGIAGGKFGGVEVNDMPGTFWFFIWAQTLCGLYMIVNAIRELWKPLHRNAEKSDQNKPSNIIAIYWIVATFLFLILNVLAIWASFEMVFNTYNLLSDYEMPRKAIFAGLYLMCFLVFCYLYYVFLFRNLIDLFFPKARSSFRVLLNNDKQHT